MRLQVSVAAFVLSVLGGCMTFGIGARVDPASVEIDVVKPTRGEESDLFVEAELRGPYVGQLYEVALERDGAKVASAHPKHHWFNLKLGESGLVQAELPFSGVEPGRHMLVLRFRGNLSLPVTAKVPVELVRLPSTAGYQIAVSPASHVRRATIRFGSTPAFDMRIPVDIRQPWSRVDVLWYQGGTLHGSFSSELSPGPIYVGQTFKVPAQLSGWPKDLPADRVSGDWSIHIIQDGEYLTSCRMSVRGRGTTTLPCAPDRSPATADARARAAHLPRGRRDAARTREVLALHRSSEVRELLLVLGRMERDADQLRVMSLVAAADKETAVTERQYKNADRRQKLAWVDQDDSAAEYRALRRRYLRAVAKYGR